MMRHRLAKAAMAVGEALTRRAEEMMAETVRVRMDKGGDRILILVNDESMALEWDEALCLSRGLERLAKDVSVRKKVSREVWRHTESVFVDGLEAMLEETENGAEEE